MTSKAFFDLRSVPAHLAEQFQASYQAFTHDGKKFGIHSLSSRLSNSSASVFFVHGRWHNASLWDRNGKRDPRWQLAAHGITVFTFDPTPAFLPSSPAAPLAMDYRVNHVIAQVRLAVDYIETRLPDKPMVVMGYSMGASLAILCPWSDFAKRPAGMILLDGGLAPDGGAKNRAPSAVPPVAFAENPAWEKRFRQAALSDGLGEESYLCRFVPDDPCIRAFLLSGNRWWPESLAREIEEIACGVATRHPEVGTLFASIDYPVLAMVTGKNTRALATAKATASKDIAQAKYVRARHADIVAGDLASSSVSTQIINWIKTRVL